MTELQESIKITKEVIEYFENNNVLIHFGDCPLCKQSAYIWQVYRDYGTDEILMCTACKKILEVLPPEVKPVKWVLKEP